MVWLLAALAAVTCGGLVWLFRRPDTAGRCPSCGSAAVELMGDGWGGYTMECEDCHSVWPERKRDDGLPPPAAT